MDIDFVAKRSFKGSLIVGFFLSLWSFDIAWKVIFGGAILFFFVLFFLAGFWALPHPERKWLIGFLVSAFHTFFIFLGGAIGIYLALLISFPTWFSNFKSWILQLFPKF